MKHYHENLNKKSRLTLDPLTQGAAPDRLESLDPGKLRERIRNALRNGWATGEVFSLAISNLVNAQTTSIPNPLGASD